MDQAPILEAIGHITAAVWVLLGFLSIRFWWRHRSATTGWAMATFMSIASIFITAEVLTALTGTEELEGIAFTAIVLLLVPFPWLLARFVASADRPRRSWVRTMDAAMAVAVVWFLLMPDFSSEPDQASSLQSAWSFYTTSVWLVLLAYVAWRLAVASRSQALVARNRSRLMAFAVFIIFVQQAVQAIGGESLSLTVQIVIGLSGIATGLLFFLALAPPRWLRATWRAPLERQLAENAIKLLRVEDSEAVGRILLPNAVQMLGASDGLLMDHDGHVLATTGAPPVTSGRHVHGPDCEADRYVFSETVLEAWTSPWAPALNDQEDRIVTQLGVLADLTTSRAALVEDLRESNDALEAMNTEMESFVYTTSHDLKNPLIAMSGYVTLLQNEYLDHLPAEAHHFIERMGVNASFMTSLIDDLLALSRVGRVDIDHEWVSVNDIIDELIVHFNDIDIDVTIKRGHLPEAFTNPIRLRQIFVNLIDNARKYAGRDDVVVTIEASATDEDHVVILVTDNGKGVPAEHRAKVFGIFERLEVDDDKTGGTGIGLALIRKIMESQGGRVWITDNRPGAQFALAFAPEHLRAYSKQDATAADETVAA